MDELILLVEYILETEKRHTTLNRLQAIEASLNNTLQASQQGNIDQARKLGKQAAGQIASLIQVLEESEPRQFTKQQRALFERLDASDLIGATAAIKLRNAMLEHVSDPSVVHGVIVNMHRRLDLLISHLKWLKGGIEPLAPTPVPEGKFDIHLSVPRDATAAVMIDLLQYATDLFDAVNALVGEPLETPSIAKAGRGSSFLDILGNLGSFVGGLTGLYLVVRDIRRRATESKNAAILLYALTGVPDEERERIAKHLADQLAQALIKQAYAGLVATYQPTHPTIAEDEKQRMLLEPADDDRNKDKWIYLFSIRAKHIDSP